MSTGEVSSPFSRWWFRRHFIQHAGFRVVRSVFSEHDGRVLQLPIRFITTSVFVLGAGAIGKIHKECHIKYCNQRSR